MFIFDVIFRFRHQPYLNILSGASFSMLRRRVILPQGISSAPSTPMFPSCPEPSSRRETQQHHQPGSHSNANPIPATTIARGESKRGCRWFIHIGVLDVHDTAPLSPEATFDGGWADGDAS
uniref:Uncharacterized protein n=1 Tax=Panagrellus redivivus TaxID=6233 RepID=A0A7E4V6I4_PANRE